MALARIMCGEPVCVARRAEKRKSFQGDGRDVPQPGEALVRPVGSHPAPKSGRWTRFPRDHGCTGLRRSAQSRQTLGFVLAKAWGFVPWLSPIDCNFRDDARFSGARPPDEW